MVYCRETCPFGLAWTERREARCSGCGLSPQACKCGEPEGASAWPVVGVVRLSDEELVGWSQGMGLVRKFGQAVERVLTSTPLAA